MATAVSICSNALLMLGASPISSFDGSDDKARLASNLYPGQRDATLRAHTWNCCVKRVQLAPLSGVSTYGWQNAFQMPGDWVRTMRVGGSGNFVADFRQQQRTLLANATVVNLRYVFRNTNEGSWDDLLVDVLTKRMAWAMCYAVTKSTSLRDTLGQEFRLALQQAKSIDSMEEPGEMVAEDSPLISIRG